MKPITERRRRSARETWDACKFRYAAEYVDGVDNGSDAARRGSTFHRFRELYVRALFKARLRQDHELAQAALSQALLELPLPWAERQDVEQMATRFMPWYELDVESFVSTEGAIPGFADTLLRLDEVTVPRSDTILITDCKTHYRVPDGATLRASWQTHFYLAGVRRIMPGFEHYQMRYEHVRYTQLSEVFELTPAELDAVDAAIEQQDIGMEAAEDQVFTAEDGTYGWPYEAFPATGGSHCRTCQAACPLVDHAKRAPVRLQTAQEAAEAVGTVEALRRAVALRTDALRAYSDLHGPVEAGGIVWAHHPVERVSYDLREVVDVLKAHEVDLAKVPKSVFEASGSHLKALTRSKKKWAFLADDVRALGKVERTTQFESKSIKLDPDEKPEDADGNA